MKKSSVLLIIMMAIITISTGFIITNQIRSSENYLFDYKTQDVYGREVNFNNFKGNTTIILIVDINNAECENQIEEFNILQSENIKNLVIVMIDISGTYSWDLQDYIDQKGIKFSVCRDMILDGDECLTCGEYTTTSKIPQIVEYTKVPSMVILDEIGEQTLVEGFKTKEEIKTLI